MFPVTEVSITPIPSNNCDLSSLAEYSTNKISHRKWRNKLKQLKRKECRQKDAQQREELLQQTPDETEVEDPYAKQFEIWAEQERQYQHQQWLLREQAAHAAFLAKKDREEKERIRREEEEVRIKVEWEERQRKEAEEEEERRKVEAEKKAAQEELLKEATANERAQDITGQWHNPIAPAGYSTDMSERPRCPFFSKVGACRFGDRCSRLHEIPEDSCTLLFPGMYANFELEQSMRDEYDTDLTLEFDESDLYQHFESFYYDVLPEFKAVGRVVQFKVCCNYEPHLRGNVYVQYSSRDEAFDAFTKFNGRWYAGRQLSCQFSCVDRWKMAICGLFHQKKCPKGRHCNFLHVYRNPDREFYNADISIDRLLVHRLPRRPWLHSHHSSRREHRPSSTRRSRSRSRSYSSRSHHRRSDEGHHSRRRSRSRSAGSRHRSHHNRSTHSKSASKSRSRNCKVHKQSRKRSRRSSEDEVGYSPRCSKRKDKGHKRRKVHEESTDDETVDINCAGKSSVVEPKSESRKVTVSKNTIRCSSPMVEDVVCMNDTEENGHENGTDKYPVVHGDSTSASDSDSIVDGNEKSELRSLRKKALMSRKNSKLKQ